MLRKGRKERLLPDKLIHAIVVEVNRRSRTQLGTSALTLAALGVVYGDIGTSPIYALKESLGAAGPTLDDVYGVVSLLFWSLMLVVTVKYLGFVLRADNAGEGGILALFSLLPGSIRQPNGRLHTSVFLIMLLGTALLFGDGFLTPAISVLSATEGLGAIDPALADYAVPLTVAILIALFSVQFKGTASLGRVFGVVILLWFATIGFLGLVATLEHPQVIGALSPAYAIDYITNRGSHTLVIMSYVILAVTGAEALYADLGHFGRRPIRIGWFLIVGPSLVLCYLGQAAMMIEDPMNRENLFFSLAPNSVTLVFLVIIATAATIIASQALITGVASLARQAAQLGLFPRLRIVHTSEVHEGQIYVPAVNTILAIGSILLVLNFRSSSALAHAYSFAIAGTFLVTTIALAIVARSRWNWPLPMVIGVIVMLGAIDLAFFTASVSKVLEGAWVPLLIALAIVYLILVWRKGQMALAKALIQDSQDWNWLEDGVSSGAVLETESFGIFLSSTAERVPQAAVAQVRNLQSIPHRVVVVTVVADDVPYSTREAIVERVNARVTHVTLYSGFMETPNVPKQLCAAYLSTEDESAATYYLSDRNFVDPESGELKGFADKAFSFLHRNSATASHYFGLPEDRVITLAVQMNL